MFRSDLWATQLLKFEKVGDPPGLYYSLVVRRLFPQPCFLLQLPGESFPDYPCLRSFCLLALMQWTACRISCHSVLIKGDGDLNQHSTHIHPIKPSWPWSELDRKHIKKVLGSVLHITGWGASPQAWLIPTSSLSVLWTLPCGPREAALQNCPEQVKGPGTVGRGSDLPLLWHWKLFTLTMNKGKNKVTTPQMALWLTRLRPLPISTSQFLLFLPEHVSTGSQLCPHTFRSSAFLVHRPPFPLHPLLAFEPRVCLTHLSPPFPLLISQSDLWISSINLSAVFRATFHWTYQCQVINNTPQFRDFSSTTGTYSAKHWAALLAQ